jgi:hypothetical protein
VKVVKKLESKQNATEQRVQNIERKLQQVLGIEFEPTTQGARP